MRKRGVKRLALFALAAVCLFALLPIPGRSAGTVQKQTTRAISIVFDNSGSMYGDGSGRPLKRWCQAIYAMEVFAAMLNGGDQLQIYPMNDIEVNGVEYKANTPLSIRGGVDADVQSIREIYTTTPDWTKMTTPIETVIAAMEGLRQMQADEHWLIVLTDGDTFYENGRAMSQTETKNRLGQLLSEYHQEVNVLYLGIFDNKSQFSLVPEIKPSSMRSMAEPSVSEDVPRVLSKMCNYIFQRDELPDGNKTKESLSFDLPMKKLIVLVQGQDLGDVSLEAGGRTVGADGNVRLQFGEKGCAGKSFDVDRTLQGTLATFTNVPAGSYTLKFGGSASDVSAYYEPDVELAVQLCDENGDPVREGQENYRGTYQIRYGLVDSSGNFTDSPLLGSTRYEIEYELNGIRQSAIVADGRGSYPLELGVGDTVNALHAEVNYLITPGRPEGYFMERNGSELGWPGGGFSIAAHPVGSLSINAAGGQNSYALHELEEAGSYEIRLYYDDAQLTGSALDRAEMQEPVLEGPGALKWELRRDGDLYRLQLKHSGAAADSAPGSYRIRLSASYENEEGQISTASGQIGFDLQEVSHSLTLELECPQSRYLINQLEEGAPLRAKLLLDGVPLTAGQMAKAELLAEGSGSLKLDTEKLPKEAAWLIRIRPDKTLAEGAYTVNVTAKLPDELGRVMEKGAAAQVELLYPSHAFTLELECPQTQYVVTQLEAGLPLRAKLLWDGVPLSAEQMAGLDFTADGGALPLDLEKLPEESAVLIRIRPDKALPEGNFVISAAAELTDELGRPIPSRGEAQIELQYPTHTFRLELENPQGYYVISQLAEGEPLRAELLLDGAPLTPEQMDQVSFVLDDGGLKLDTEKLPEESAWRIRIRPGAQPKGRHTIRVSAQLEDELGRPMQDEAKAAVTLQTFPAWVPWVLAALILLLILLLIWLYLNAKILPKAIRASSTVFTVDGTSVPGTAICEFRGAKKHKGDLSVKLPKYSANPGVKAGMSFQLEAISPRRVKSAARRAKITSISFINGTSIDSAKIGPVAFIKNPTTNKLERKGAVAGKDKKEPPPIEIGTNTSCIISGTLYDNTTYSANVKLRFI